MNQIKFLFAFSILFFFACGDDDEIIDKPKGSEKSIPVYNQAYNENFDSDKIADIILNAQNAYVLIDPFQDDVAESVSAIHASGNEVGAYISVGTGENWRDDFQELLPYLVTLEWDQWEGEFFINTTTTGVIDVMKARIDKIADWGCDWVEFDNMDWVDEEYRAVYQYEVTEEEVVAYFQELCDYIHTRGMKCMSKNRTNDAFGFDGVTMESYSDDQDWWDVESLKNFIAEDKVAIIIHYNETNCNQVYADYIEKYGSDLSYLCEDHNLEKYVHYNND